MPAYAFATVKNLRKGDDAGDDEGEDEDEGDDNSDSGDDSDSDGSDFDSKHPRWAAGSPGGIGGEFAPKDTGDATSALHDAIATDAQSSNPLDPGSAWDALTNGIDRPSQLGEGTTVAGDGVVPENNIDSNILDTWGSLDTLSRHVREHAADFNIDALDPYAGQNYATQANDFFQRLEPDTLPAFEYPNGGEIAIWEPETNTFGLYNADGTTITFYKPTSPTYFERAMQDALSRGGKVINSLPSQENTLNTRYSSPEINEGGGGGGGG